MPKPKPKQKLKRPAMPGAGRPRTPINWKDAEYLASIQCTCKEIAGSFGLTDDTLMSRCKDELGVNYSEWFKLHSEGGKSSLRRSMWKMATAERPNPAICIWLSKQHLGMRDSFEEERPQLSPTFILWGDQRVELGYNEVKPTQIIDVESQTDEQ